MKRLCTFLLSFMMLLFCAVTAMPVSTALADGEDFACDYSAAAIDNKYVKYGSSEVITYSADQAAAAGVPSGYENQVIKVISLSGIASMGVLVDFSAKRVPLNVVDGIRARIYMGTGNTDANYPQFRIHNPASPGNWIYNSGPGLKAGEWITVDIPATGFSIFSVDGYLDKFELGVRTHSAIDYYIDSIAVNLKANDGVAPVITCDVDTVEWVEGVPLQMDATAYDAFEDRNIDIEYVYGNDVQLDEDGNLKHGQWQVTLVAKDYYGNTAQKVVTVNVKEIDNTAPVITTTPNTIYATVGTVPVLNPKATDDNGEVTVTGVWSQGALDSNGKLTAGTHSYVITATDLSGNTATHTITVVVSADGGLGSDFIDEQEMLDGGNQQTPTQPSEPSGGDSSSNDNSTSSSSDNDNPAGDSSNSNSDNDNSAGGCMGDVTKGKGLGAGTIIAIVVGAVIILKRKMLAKK